MPSPKAKLLSGTMPPTPRSSATVKGLILVLLIGAIIAFFYFDLERYLSLEALKAHGSTCIVASLLPAAALGLTDRGLIWSLCRHGSTVHKKNQAAGIQALDARQSRQW